MPLIDMPKRPTGLLRRVSQRKTGFDFPWKHVGAAAAVALVVGAGTASARAKDLVLEDYFAGHTYAYGTFSAINGVTRRFSVETTGRMRPGHRFDLTEDIRYEDGQHEVKTWRFVRTGPATYTGTREDVIGTTTVRLDGNKARFSYLVDLDPGPGRKAYRFHDTLVLEDDGSLRNSSWVSKLIFPVAWVHVNFARSKAAAAAIKPR